MAEGRARPPGATAFCHPETPRYKDSKNLKKYSEKMREISSTTHRKWSSDRLNAIRERNVGPFVSAEIDLTRAGNFLLGVE